MVKPWNKRMSSLFGYGHCPLGGAKTTQRLPKGSVKNPLPRQTDCLRFLARAMIKWVLWWRCWCFGFQRPLCLCSSAERVCSAERELDRPWCEYELHEWGSLPGCRVQQAQAVFKSKAQRPTLIRVPGTNQFTLS